MTGTLGLFSLVDLFQLLASSSRTGRLLVDHPEGAARIYFERGRVIHADFGEVQGVDAVYRLFCNERGSFEFGLGLPAPDTTIRMSLDNLLLEAIRRVDETRRNEPKDGSVLGDDVVPTLTGSDTGKLTLFDQELRVLRLVDGERDLEGIALASGLALHVVQSTVLRLSQVGALELKNKKPRVARLVAQLSKRGLPLNTVGVDEQIFANWARALGFGPKRVACRRPDGKVDVFGVASVPSAGPHLLFSRETLFTANLAVNTALLVKPLNEPN